MTRIFTFLLCFILFAACNSEEAIVDTGEGNGGSAHQTQTDADVRFALKVPSLLDTRAMTEPQENVINSASILLFDGTNGNKIYRYKLDIRNNISSPASGQTTFTAKLPKGNYDIVILANADAIIQSSGIKYGDTKAEVLDSLIESGTGKWKRNDIPSFGLKDNFNIDGKNNLTGTDAITMIRMMAKIDVSVAQTATPSFKLETVHLYNYSTQGTLTPDLTQWTGGNTASLPSMPARGGGYAPMAFPDSLVYDKSDGLTDAECKRVIYTYEAPAGSDASRNSNICVVVGGKYNNNATTYYRIDFVRPTSSGIDYVPLVRNHRYQLNIVSVTGNGFSSPKDAFNSGSANMVTSLIAWDEYDIKDIIFDNHDMLGVSTRKLHLPFREIKSDKDENRISIITNVSSGWKIDPNIRDASGAVITWATVADKTWTVPNQKKDIYVHVDSNLGTAPRTAYITLRSGKLTCEIEVTQDDNPIPPRMYFLQPKLDGYYMMDGKPKSFKIDCLGKWKVKDIVQNHNIITNRTALINTEVGDDMNYTTDAPFDFDITDDMTNYQIRKDTVSIIFTSAKGDSAIKIPAISLFTPNPGGGGIWFWPEDVPEGENWYTYSDIRQDAKDESGRYVSGNQGPLKPILEQDRTYPNQQRSAANSCASLDPNDKNMWRLPNRYELVETIEYIIANGGQQTFDPITGRDQFGFKNVTFFGNGAIDAIDFYLSSKTSGTNVGQAIGIAYNTKYKQSTTIEINKLDRTYLTPMQRQSKIYVRCVRDK
jgi:hypothetical protein